MGHRLRVLELYCGIGGCAAAVGDRAQIVAAVDINLKALEVVAHNFPHPRVARTLESIPTKLWREWQADLWWLSPPCQPYTQRGRQRDLDDPRAASFVVVLDRLAELRPPFVALENVPGFHGSKAYGRLREVLHSAGYAVHERLLCPTDLGVPNRRRRFYLVASRQGALAWDSSAARLGPVQSMERLAGRARLLPSRGPDPDRKTLFSVREILDPHPQASLGVPEAMVEQYAGALHRVDAAEETAECACFTAGYGRSFVRSGSYLVTHDGLRRFSPAEILRLLCFPAAFTLPPQLTPRQAWPLVGNSLSVRAVQAVLEPVFERFCNRG